MVGAYEMSKKSVTITVSLIGGACILAAAVIKGGFGLLKPSGTVTQVTTGDQHQSPVMVMGNSRDVIIYNISNPDKQKELNDLKKRPERATDSDRNANVEKHNLELQTTLERERTTRLKLEQQIKKREITSVQRIKLLALLKDGPKGIVYLRPKSFDAETEQYGKQMASVLREAGFDVRECEEATLSWSLTGAFLLVKNLQKLPPHTFFVQNSFRAVDILLAAYENPNVPDDSIMIGIGERF